MDNKTPLSAEEESLEIWRNRAHYLENVLQARIKDLEQAVLDQTPDPLIASMDVGQRMVSYDTLVATVNLARMELSRLKRRIKELESGQGMRWVKASEELPKEGGRYWCYIKELTDLGWSYFQWNCYYDPEEKRFSDSTLTKGENVTHWMPLPPPPKEEGPGQQEREEAVREAEEILTELCALKAYKDKVGKDAHYRAEQPKAWERARAFLQSKQS
jgi:BMFP domain-containing protein YqiC